MDNLGRLGFFRHYARFGQLVRQMPRLHASCRAQAFEIATTELGTPVAYRFIGTPFAGFPWRGQAIIERK
jgi:hypothetical protein